jgi:hypothetical protein
MFTFRTDARTVRTGIPQRPKPIVDEVSRIVLDPKMAGRSIGVISLIAAKQAQLIQAMLLERIGEDAFLRHGTKSSVGIPLCFRARKRTYVCQ